MYLYLSLICHAFRLLQTGNEKKIEILFFSMRLASIFVSENNVMQYSQYCRDPAAKAGRATHEISGRSPRGQPHGSGGSRSSRSSSVSGGPAAANAKCMRTPRPQTPRQGKIPCTPANPFAVFEKFNAFHQFVFLRKKRKNSLTLEKNGI